ncbi:AAA family ATPase [Fundidesulfovibrio agrisoli]|uniref:AAA family ATPase n=1 Tax=Fundidesulfovibrio agrisoli TaxID=2922717 RepID=UPI0024352594|nr:AAA family ATPase [Fundidesulfovibrio agrisoli]
MSSAQKKQNPGGHRGSAENRSCNTFFLPEPCSRVKAIDLSKSPPAAPDAEAAVLAASILKPERLTLAAESLTPEDFHAPDHRSIYGAMLALRSNGKGVDLLTLADELSRLGRLDTVGGSVRLAEIASLGCLGNFPEHLGILKEMTARRKVIGVGLALYDGGHDLSANLPDLAQMACNLGAAVVAGKPRLVVADAAQLLSMQLPQREYFLNPVIPRQGLVMIYAPRGVGKTFVALTLAYAVASGQRVFRWQAPQPRRVLYLDGEMPASTMQERLAAIVTGFEQELPGPDWLRFITPDLQGIGARMPNLATPEGQAALLPHLEGVDLVILDNLATLARAGRENDAEGWLPVQEWMLGLRQRGLSVCLIHHAGKGGQQRGTSSREDVLDTVIALKRPPDYRQEEGARFEVHLEKARGICGDEAKSFEATLDAQGEALVWRCKDIEDVRLAQVQALHSEGMTVRDIAEETGIARSTVHRMVKKLKAA